jgi:hypothetical protein
MTVSGSVKGGQHEKYIEADPFGFAISNKKMLAGACRGWWDVSYGWKCLLRRYSPAARGNGIPGFLAVSSSSMVSRSGSSGETSDGGFIGLETGVLASGRPMLFVVGIHKDLTTEILDALMLPPDLIDWYFEGDFEYALQHDQAHLDRYFKWHWQTGQPSRFTLSESCGSNKEDERMIIGLIKQEKGKETCSHYSKRVKFAWLLDKKSKRLTPISTRGLQCHYISEEDCY